MQRLDDASAGIRILAVSVIPKLEPVVEAKDEITESTNASRTAIKHDVWLTFVKQSMDMLFLHYDNPEKRLQATIKGKYFICQLKQIMYSISSFHLRRNHFGDVEALSGNSQGQL